MAEEAEDPVAHGEVHPVLSWVLERKACHNQAFQHASQALGFHDSGHTIGQARALNTIGWFHSQLGNYDEAIAFCESALRLHETLGHREGQAATWHSMGFALHHLGQHERALACYDNSLSLYRQLQDRYYEGTTLDSLADTLAAIGKLSAASTARHQALAILGDMGHPRADEVRTKISAAGSSKVVGLPDSG
jgi:tetratricopeptide (TPR) repeat protein